MYPKTSLAVVALSLGMLLTVGCGRGTDRPATVAQPGNALRASAPTGMGEQSLGRAVDANFNEIPGVPPLFTSESVSRTPLNGMRHEFREVLSETEFAANAHAWKVFNANIGASTGMHHATYRAYQTSYSAQIDSKYQMAPPPPNAAYYIAQVEFGHSFEAVISGDWNRFNARVGLDLKKWGGDIGAFAGQHGLDYTAAGSGMQPLNGQAIFAQDQTSVQQHYAAVGPPVAIFVSYQPIRGAIPPGNPTMTGPAVVNVVVQFNQVIVGKTGSWFSDRWSLSISCALTGQRPIPRQVLTMQKVSKGEALALSYQETIPAVPGERITCTFQGTAHDQGRSLNAVPFDFTVPNGNTRMPVVHQGGTGKTEYKIEGLIAVSP